MNQRNINHDPEETIEREEMGGIPQSSFHQSFQRLSKNKREKEKICKAAQKDFERIQDWKQTELKKFEQDDAYDTNLIARYHQQNPTTKTITTPWGTSKIRASKESVEKVDEKVLLQFLLENDYKQFIEPKLKWGGMKPSLHIVEMNGKKVVIDEAGQRVQGVRVKPASISHSLEVLG